MRRIIRWREIVADTALYPGETDGAGMRRVQPVAEFLATADATAAAHGADAVLLGPTDEVERLMPHLPAIDLIVIHFPSAGDGRGFSQARLLRQRCRYDGELRARGALKRDQLFFLARCGFDSFDLDPSEDLEAALTAFDTFSVAYQAGSDDIVQVRQREVP
jgi:uncharacterized protein (DUF934 family)